MSWKYKFHVFTIIQPTYNCKFTIQWYYNNKATSTARKVFAFGVGLARITPNSDWIRGLTLSSLHIQSKCGKKTCTRKNLPTRTLSTQWSGFVVHKLKSVFVSKLDVSSFLWFSMLLPWCSVINNFSFKNKSQIPVLFVVRHLFKM